MHAIIPVFFTRSLEEYDPNFSDLKVIFLALSMIYEEAELSV